MDMPSPDYAGDLDDISREIIEDALRQLDTPILEIASSSTTQLQGQEHYTLVRVFESDLLYKLTLI